MKLELKIVENQFGFEVKILAGYLFKKWEDFACSYACYGDGDVTCAYKTFEEAYSAMEKNLLRYSSDSEVKFTYKKKSKIGILEQKK